MFKYNKTILNKNTLLISLLGALLGMIISFGLIVLGTVLLNGGYCDLNAMDLMSYITHLISGVLTMLVMNIFFKTDGVLSCFITTVIYALFCILTGVFAFNKLGGVIFIKVLMFLIGGTMMNIIKNALQSRGVTKKKRTRNW